MLATLARPNSLPSEALTAIQLVRSPFLKATASAADCHAISLEKGRVAQRGSGLDFGLSIAAMIPETVLIKAA